MRRPFKHKSRSRRGITLIEVLVAVLILAIGLMSLMGVWLFSFGITRCNDEIGVAYNLARDSVERLHSMGYLYASPTGIKQWYGPAQEPLNDQTGAYYRLRATVTTSTDQPTGQDYLGLKQIDVIVTRVSDGAELCRTKSYLTLGGV